MTPPPTSTHPSPKHPKHTARHSTLQGPLLRSEPDLSALSVGSGSGRLGLFLLLALGGPGALATFAPLAPALAPLLSGSRATDDLSDDL